MLFTILVLVTALFIEGIGTYISILGLSALFAGSPVVITMAVALDVGKVVAVSFIYKNWEKISLLMKTYMSIAAVVLMIITSAGVFGYLSGEFQKAIAGNNQQTVVITALEEERSRLQARKQEIDAQIANLPANFVNSRVRLMNQFRDETRRINDRLAKIDEELPKLKVDIIGQSVKIGPIIYIAEAFGTSPEKAVKWVIFVIIFVFDPLAIALLIAGNFLLAQRGKAKPTTEVERATSESPSSRDVYVEAPSQPVGAAEPSATIEPTIKAKEEPGHDVINISINEDLKTSMKPVKTNPKKLVQEEPVVKKEPVKSSLESVDARRGDVNVGVDVGHIPRNLTKVYRDGPDDRDTVQVGGPTSRK